jgi:G6PDH family F420-dependent oxidoreductase
MLAEAIHVIRMLWKGGQQSYQGKYFDLDQARLYSLPAAPPPLIVAASGRRMAEMAARLGDGLVGLSPDQELVEAYLAVGDVQARPRYAQMAVCWAKDEAAARRTALDWWPLGLLPGKVIPELPLPGHYEALAAQFGVNDISRAVVCGADPALHLAKIQQFIDAGFTHIYVHQIGPDQEGFMQFYQDQILSKFHSA